MATTAVTGLRHPTLQTAAAQAAADHSAGRCSASALVQCRCHAPAVLLYCSLAWRCQRAASPHLPTWSQRVRSLPARMSLVLALCKASQQVYLAMVLSRWVTTSTSQSAHLRSLRREAATRAAKHVTVGRKCGFRASSWRCGVKHLWTSSHHRLSHLHASGVDAMQDGTVKMQRKTV